MSRVLVDAGPIVALLQPREKHHEWAARAFGAIEPPLHTCEPVLTEAAHLLRKMPGGTAAILELLARRVLEVAFRVETEVLSLKTLTTRYASVPMSLADACLVRMAEMDPKASVLTLDSDFRIYRRGGRLTIPVIMPDRLSS